MEQGDTTTLDATLREAGIAVAERWDARLSYRRTKTEVNVGRAKNQLLTPGAQRDARCFCYLIFPFLWVA